jgi:hypothetical protein
MWSQFGRTTLLLVTINTTISPNGELIMGAGIAKQAASRIPYIKKDFGEALESPSRAARALPLCYAHYGSVPQLVGGFITKTSPWDNAHLSLTRNSTVSLFNWMTNFKMASPRQPLRVDLNFPGIGLGGLERDDVRPIIDMLPDCVHIWEYKKPKSPRSTNS